MSLDLALLLALEAANTETPSLGTNATTPVDAYEDEDADVDGSLIGAKSAQVAAMAAASQAEDDFLRRA